MTKPHISILDTTLRDGEQGEGISFTVQDKLQITQLLDELGIHYIEGGWPGSNPKAIEYFKKVKELSLSTSKITAFGSTRRANIKAKDDKNLKALIASDPDTCVIFGKSWDFHVTNALKITLSENLKMIEDSVAFLKSHNKEVIYDAEHFFDGYKQNPAYAIKTLKAAERGGVDILCLCDTNGGTLPTEIGAIVKQTKKEVSSPLGIHTHNDSGLGIATAIAAVENGVVHVQGTMNGYGERCGNANLSTILPILRLKLNHACISNENLEKLTTICRNIDDIANITPNKAQPFVGRSAFAHKGGIHVSAVLKHPETYEHIDPRKVGNQQRVLVSELSGASNLLYKAESYGVSVKKGSTDLQKLLNTIKDLENKGYHFENAEASFKLLMYKFLKQYTPKLHLESFEVTTEKVKNRTPVVDARIKAKINGASLDMTTKGKGPVGALDKALRTCLEAQFPELKTVKLVDYKVRVLNSKSATNAVVRVLITSFDGEKSWNTVGVSENIIEASWFALVDSFEYKLLQLSKGDDQ